MWTVKFSHEERKNSPDLTKIPDPDCLRLLFQIRPLWGQRKSPAESAFQRISLYCASSSEAVKSHATARKHESFVLSLESGLPAEAG